MGAVCRTACSKEAPAGQVASTLQTPGLGSCMGTHTAHGCSGSRADQGASPELGSMRRDVRMTHTLGSMHEVCA